MITESPEIPSSGQPDRSIPTGERGAGSTPTAAERFGYLVAIAFNAVMLYVVHNLLEWDVLSFLTEAFDEVVPVISLSLGVTMAVNVARLAYNPKWFVAITDIIATSVSLVATVRVWQVFPFDFSAWDFPWSGLTRFILVVAIAGSIIGILAALVKLSRSITAEAGVDW